MSINCDVECPYCKEIGTTVDKEAYRNCSLRLWECQKCGRSCAIRVHMETSASIHPFKFIDLVETRK